MGVTTLYRDTEGREAFVDWRAKKAIAAADLAELFGVTIHTVRQWSTGRQRPHEHHRLALEALVGIPAKSWLLKSELTDLQSWQKQIKDIKARRPQSADFRDRIALRM